MSADWKSGQLHFAPGTLCKTMLVGGSPSASRVRTAMPSASTCPHSWPEGSLVNGRRQLLHYVPWIPQ